MIAYDLDGVIINIMPHVREWFKTNRGFDIWKKQKAVFHCWHPASYDPCRFKQDFALAIIWAQQYAQPVEEDTITALYAIEELTGCEPLFISARHKSTEDVTIDWLNKWLDIDYGLEIVDGAKAKVEYIKNLNKVVKSKYQIKYYVEDRFRTCEQLAEIIDTVFCYNQEWNLGRDFTSPNVIRVRDLWDVHQYLDKN